MSDEQLSDYYSIRTVLKSLPGNVKAFSAPMGDGYAVVVNEALGPDERAQALAHELNHIANNDHFDELFNEYDE